MNGKELKEKLQAAGINLAELSRKMGYKTDQNLHSVLGAKEMSSGVIERMAEATGKPIGWFYGKEETAEPARRMEPDTVPLLPIFAQAGSLSGWSEGVEEVKCERVISPVKDVDMAVHIYGESMSPDIPNGAVCYVRRVTGRVIDYGRAYILDTVDGPVVKYLMPGSDEEHVRCLSANKEPRFAPYEVLKTDILGMYRVVMCMKMM